MRPRDVTTSGSAASGGVVCWCVESTWLVCIACGAWEGGRLSLNIGKGGKERERKEGKQGRRRSYHVATTERGE